MEIIKTITLEEACELTGRDIKKSLLFPTPENSEEEGYNALRRLNIYIEAHNMVDGKKWVPDYENDDEEKWYILFEWDVAAAAFRFHYTFIGYSGAVTHTGSRHAIRTEELAEHIGRAYIEDWNKWLKP